MEVLVFPALTKSCQRRLAEMAVLQDTYTKAGVFDRRLTVWSDLAGEESAPKPGNGGQDESSKLSASPQGVQLG